MPQQRWYGSFWLNGETDGDNCGAERAIYPDAETRAKTAHARVDSSDVVRLVTHLWTRFRTEGLPASGHSGFELLIHPFLSA